MPIDLAIIGGTGVGSMLGALPGRALCVATREGALRGRIVQFGGSAVLAILRHSAGHSVPPHRVNYRAVALGLKAAGVKQCLATAAVGSLHSDWPVGTIVPCVDFLDCSGRNLTLFESQVHHTAMDHPFGGGCGVLAQAIAAHGVVSPPGAVYVQANGPRYESAAEITAFARMGGDVVGMTAASEAETMREAGIRYECLAIVTNLAAGLGNEIDHSEVGSVMESNADLVAAILATAVGLVAKQGGKA